jgi:hypothetical protein
MLRLASVAVALIATGCLGAVPSDARQRPADGPTRLDYLLLLSLADRQQLLSMAAYQPSR